MLRQRLQDRAAIGRRVRNLTTIFGRKAAAQIDQGQMHALGLQPAEQVRGLGQCVVPLLRIALLRADMERHADRGQPLARRGLQQLFGHGHVAAELARQRPVGADAGGQDAAEHLRARGGLGQLVQLGLAVERIEPHAQRIGGRDIDLLLDRVAERDVLRRGAGGQRHADFRDAGGVEARAQAGQPRQDLGRRVGLHRVIDVRIGHRPADVGIILFDDIQVEHQARRSGSSVFQELCNFVSH